MAQSQKLVRHARGRAVPQKRSRLPLFAVAAALILLVVGAIVVSNLGSDETATVSPYTPRPLNAPTGTTPDGFAYKGDPNAPVKVIEYGDFQCPSCAAYATQMEEQIDRTYVETGKVQFIYHDFPLPQHPHAVTVASAVRAAGEQGQYWAMHDLLFERQRQWSNRSDILPLLRGYADVLGLDRAAFDRAMDSGKYTAALEAAREAAGQRGVQATPTFDVNGTLVSAAELEGAIEAALQTAQ
jgi:protein-disulfide isomerase